MKNTMAAIALIVAATASVGCAKRPQSPDQRAPATYPEQQSQQNDLANQVTASPAADIGTEDLKGARGAPTSMQMASPSNNDVIVLPAPTPAPKPKKPH